MVLCLIMAIIFLILGILLLFGKGEWLIAGYNTMSEEEKEKYDSKKLCRAVSVICFVCSVMLVIMAYLGHRVDIGLMEENNMLIFAIVFVLVIFTTLIATSIYINKKAKK